MLNKEEIQSLIPHRDPMLLIDEVIACVPGVSATAVKYLTGGESFLKGHFPEFPIMPGALTLEALAQTAAVAMALLPENKGRIGFFAGADGVRFKRKILPGDKIVLNVTIKNPRDAIVFADAQASVNGKIAAVAVISFGYGGK
jgi:3-hydroxyacyl-[acyl-carrier-protein] dehydratase